MKKQIYLTIAISGVLLLLSSTFNSCIQEGTLSKATIETNQVTSVTEATAICGGVISGDGGSDVTARGVCWSTSPNPKIENDTTIDAAGTGSFTSVMKGLSPSTTYYVRAYAINKGGNSYGLQMIFTTKTLSITTTPIAISLVTATSAIGGGNIISDGESSTLTVKARGVCWNTFPSPTIANSKTTDGVGGGKFTSRIDSLAALTTYYVRAYATNGNGTIYGNEVSFTTLSGVIKLTTDEVSSITFYTATSGGTISSDGGEAVTERGICWNTSENPTTANSKTTNGSGRGTFTSSITGLTPSTTYSVRSYASNSVGTAYGNSVSFTTRNTDFLMGLSFDEGAGTQLTADGKGWTAVLKKGPTEIFGTATNFPSFINGKVGKAMYFSNGSHLEISDYNASDLLGSRLSIAVWVKPDLTRGGNYIMSYNYWKSWKFQLQEQNKPFFTTTTGAGGTDADNQADFSAPNGEWTHLVVSMDLTNGKLVFYVNGVNTMEWTTQTKPNFTGTLSSYATTLPLMVGACTTYTEALTWDWSWDHVPANWDGLFGAMDELKLYNIALTGEQVSKLYNEEK